MISGDDWPFAERRYPSLTNPDYLGSKALSNALQATIEKELAGKENLNILDVGCGQKPFFPFLKPYARSYIGTDITGDPQFVDQFCPAEDLTIADEWADLSLCFSVLEHVNDPAKSVEELFRVTRRGGMVFASTHGAFPWHPYPQDHWRWTQTGLPILFQKYGGFPSIQISSTRGSISALFTPFIHFTYAWCIAKKIPHWMQNFLVKLLNSCGESFDRKTPSLHDINRPVTFIPEFFIIAKK